MHSSLIKAKKILIIADSLILGGGTERVISTLSQQLSENYDVNILTLNHSRKLYHFSGNYFTLQIGKRWLNKLLKITKLFNLYYILKIFQISKYIRPDIIISFAEYVNFLTIISKKAFRMKMPLIISVRCNPRLQYQNKSLLFQFLIKHLYKSKTVNNIITVSKGVSSLLNHQFCIPNNKIHTIYNFIDIEKIKKISTHTVNKDLTFFHNSDIFKFITVGRLSYEKGHLNLIKAFKKVLLQKPNAYLVIIGDGELKRSINAIIQDFKLDKQVFLLGNRRNPYKFLDKSDVFVLSSYYEGFPNSLIEALACGLPVISTNCDYGPREILGNNEYGLLVEVNSIKSLAESMILMAKNHKLRIKFINQGLKRAKDFDINNNIFDWIKVVERYI